MKIKTEAYPNFSLEIVENYKICNLPIVEFLIPS